MMIVDIGSSLVSHTNLPHPVACFDDDSAVIAAPQDAWQLTAPPSGALLPGLGTGGASMDFKQFYLSADGRVNRKQWWLWLILPLFIISIIASIIDAASGHDPQQGLGPVTAIFTLLVLYPFDRRLHQALPRPRQVRLVGADRAHPHHRRNLAAHRMRLPQGHAGAEPVRSARHGLMTRRVEALGQGDDASHRRPSSSSSASISCRRCRSCVTG